MTPSDKNSAKIAEDASPRRHAEISPVEVKDTHLMNNKLPPAEILCGEWIQKSACFIPKQFKTTWSKRVIELKGKSDVVGTKWQEYILYIVAIKPDN